MQAPPGEELGLTRFCRDEAELIGPTPGCEPGASMNDTAGFSDFTESVQLILFSFQGKSGIFVESAYRDNETPIAGGREIFGGSAKARASQILPRERGACRHAAYWRGALRLRDHRL